MARKGRKLREFMHKCECPNNNLFIVALLAIIVFLVVELLARVYQLYRVAPLIDVPTHFFAGVALAAVGSWVVSLMAWRRKWLVVLVFSLGAALFWEVLETLDDLLFYNPEYLRDVFFWDGVFDVVFTVVGALVALVLLERFRKRLSVRHH